jgi:hypothetical protein
MTLDGGEQFQGAHQVLLLLFCYFVLQESTLADLEVLVPMITERKLALTLKYIQFLR